jgi:hypothetical protein
MDNVILLREYRLSVSCLGDLYVNMFCKGGQLSQERGPKDME